MPIRICKLIVLIIFALPVLSNAMGIVVHSTASVSLGNGVIDMGCGDSIVTGTVNLQSGAIINSRHVEIAGGHLNAGAGRLTLSGNWINNGTFTQGTSRVTIQDGCSATISRIEGDTTFFAFSVSSASGKILDVAAGSTQVFDSSLKLLGGFGNPLVIQSSSIGNAAFFSLDPTGTQDILAVKVKDNNASGGQLLKAAALLGTGSLLFGNVINWAIDGVFLNDPADVVPVPTLSLWALLLLSLAIVSVVVRRQRVYFDRGRRRLAL